MEEYNPIKEIMGKGDIQPLSLKGGQPSSQRDASKLSWKQKVAIKGVKWAEKIAIRKARKDIGNLYEKHKALIDVVLSNVEELVTMEPEERHPQMVAVVVANIICAFDTRQEMRIVMHMVEETVKSYQEEAKVPEN